MRPRRAATIVLNLLLLANALLLVASGLMNSHDLFPFLRTDADILDRRIHAWAAHWILVLASLHLGLHWPMVASEVRKLLGARAAGRVSELIWRAGTLLFVGFGVAAIFERDLPLKLAGLYAFNYWDFDRSVFGFFVRYAAIMSVGVCHAHLGQKFLRVSPPSDVPPPSRPADREI